MTTGTQAPPMVRYEVFARKRRFFPWKLWDGALSTEFSCERTMPTFALLPAVLATFLHDVKASCGEWQLRVISSDSGELVAVVTLGVSI
jgi:hypothetical protein